MQNLATRLLHLLPPETAHHAAINLLRYLPVKNCLHDIDLSEFKQTIHGLNFAHPIGLAAGFDKDAEVFHQLGRLGFAFVEVGSITPQPQPGNAKPRLFRLKEQAAIINSYGFNSKGLTYAKKQLQKHPHTCITGINLGKNKTTTNYLDDFLQGANALINEADYFTINVSSPNTPGLRDLQTATGLQPIIDGIHALLQAQARKIPLFIKLSPDMARDQETRLIEFLAEQPIDGLIISNTTLNREGIFNTQYKNLPGGLSGPPLKTGTTAMLQRVHKITGNKLLLIGCGGIQSGQDAYEKLCAGARLLQIYTAFIYQGPFVLRKILLELKTIFNKNGIKNIAEIMGNA